MWIDLALAAAILLVLLGTERRAPAILLGAILAYRRLPFPHDVAAGLILLQVALAVARHERPRDAAEGALVPEGTRLFSIDKDRIVPGQARDGG